MIGRALGIQRFIKLAQGGFSVASMLKSVLTEGISYTYSLMRQDASFARQSWTLENAFVDFDPDRLITKNRMIETRWDRPAAFRVYGIMSWQDISTGERHDSWASFYTNYRGTLNQYEQDFLAQYEFPIFRKYAPDMQLYSFIPQAVAHNRAYGYQEYPEIKEL